MSFYVFPLCVECLYCSPYREGIMAILTPVVTCSNAFNVRFMTHIDIFLKIILIVSGHDDVVDLQKHSAQLRCKQQL